MNKRNRTHTHNGIWIDNIIFIKKYKSSKGKKWRENIEYMRKLIKS